MPRGPRVDAPGAIQHVWVRGVERRTILADDHDRLELTRRLARVLAEGGAACLAWALMSNHFHLVIEVGAAPLSSIMARLGTGYAMYFNARHQRVGHLVQNRFGSRIVAADEAYLNLIAYVHLNPLRAGMVGSLDELARFRWCGHGAMLGRAREAFHDPERALGLIDASRAAASRAVLGQMRASLAAEASPPSPLEALIADETRRLGVDPRDITSGRRGLQISRARVEIARRALAELDLSRTSIARALGVSRPAISQGLRRARAVEQARPLDLAQGAGPVLGASGDQRD